MRRSMRWSRRRAAWRLVETSAAFQKGHSKVAFRTEFPAGRFCLFFCTSIVLAACSPSSDASPEANAVRDALEAREPATIRSARHACRHLREPQGKHEEFDVGISDYEACLGERANLTHPANRQLCDIAKSTMSPAGTCILSE